MIMVSKIGGKYAFEIYFHDCHFKCSEELAYSHYRYERTSFLNFWDREGILLSNLSAGLVKLVYDITYINLLNWLFMNYNTFLWLKVDRGKFFLKCTKLLVFRKYEPLLSGNLYLGENR